MGVQRYYMVVDGLCCQEGRTYLNMLMRCNPGVRSVSVSGSVACVETERVPNKADWARQINESGLLFTKERLISTKNPTKMRLLEFAVIAGVLACVYLLLRFGFGIDLTTTSLELGGKMTLGAAFAVGLFSSVHCMCMCGAVSLSAAFGGGGVENGGWRLAALYNAGRVVSYAAAGAVAGALGSVVQLSQTLSGVLVLLAGGMMAVMSLNMAGIVSIPLFRCVARRAECGRGAFAAGLMNVLMPCGALQSMELCALATGDPLLGAMLMALFCLGTVPLMFGVGATAASVGGAWRIWATKIASVLVLFLSLMMIGRGATVLGLGAGTAASSLVGYPGYSWAQLDGDVQTVSTSLGSNGYGDIVVYEGIPVEFTIHVEEGALTSCNRVLRMDAFGVGQVELSVGDNVISFTPDSEGNYSYSCWMGMITNGVAVVSRPE